MFVFTLIRKINIFQLCPENMSLVLLQISKERVRKPMIKGFIIIEYFRIFILEAFIFLDIY